MAIFLVLALSNSVNRSLFVLYTQFTVLCRKNSTVLLAVINDKKELTFTSHDIRSHHKVFNRPLICKPLHFCILKCLSIFQNSLPGYNIGSWFRVKLIFHTDQHILRGKTWIHPNKGIEPFMRIWTFDEDQPPNVQSISYFIHFKIKKTCMFLFIQMKRNQFIEEKIMQSCVKCITALGILLHIWWDWLDSAYNHP